MTEEQTTETIDQEVETEEPNSETVESETSQTEGYTQSIEQAGEDLAEILADKKKREQEHYDEIRELNREFVAAHMEWEILKDQTSGKKKYCDELGKRLSNLISAGPDAQRKLNLDLNAEGDQNQANHDAGQVEADNTAWRDVLVVDALGLTAAQYDRLEDNGIKNMGQLEDFRGSKGLASIKGFGEVAVTKIEDQIIDWLTDNRDRFGEVEDECSCGESDCQSCYPEGLESDDDQTATDEAEAEAESGSADLDEL